MEYNPSMMRDPLIVLHSDFFKCETRELLRSFKTKLMLYLLKTPTLAFAYL